jgi:hypothetical protein
VNDKNNSPEIIHRRDDVRGDDIPGFVLGWWGWASPIGLGLFLIAIGISAILIRIAFVGIR